MFLWKVPIFVGISFLLPVSPFLSESNDLHNITQVHTTEGLHQALSSAKSRTIITLSEGTYLGPFELTTDGLTINGLGNGTIIKLLNSGTEDNHEVGLNILGSNCIVQNLQIISKSKIYTTGLQLSGYGSIIKNVQFYGLDFALETLSNDNQVSKILIKDGNEGITISANVKNTFDNVDLENMGGHIVLIDFGDNNTISNMTCVNCPKGLKIEGNENIIFNVEMRNPRNHDSSWGILISSGTYNLIDGFKGYGSKLGLGPESTNNKIRNSICGSISLSGTEHILENITVGEVTISGDGGYHKIQFCNVGQLYNWNENVEIIKSTFGRRFGLDKETRTKEKWAFPNFLRSFGLCSFCVFVSYLIFFRIYKMWISAKSLNNKASIFTK